MVPDKLTTSAQVKQTQETLLRLRVALNRTLCGKEAVIEHVLTCLFARGHLLIEDLPGLGKTTLAKGLAQAIGGIMARVQCTPDLLPSDITGFSIFNQQTRAFEFQRGPVFADVLLIDEINRATPRTQSALLEAMAERQITVDNQRYTLSDTFFVIATQNPCEHHGTYPLPEAQLDRFGMRLEIGYASKQHEVEILQNDVIIDLARRREPLSAILEPGMLLYFQEQVARIQVVPCIQQYLVDLAHATRQHPQVHLGLSPRGLLMWQRLAKARAFLQGRHFVIPDDLLHVAQPVLSIHLGMESNADNILVAIIQSVPVPIIDS
ncbi:MAG: hypothetical protein HJJLKODD_00160 [Phycisphaerae bacterium]|nr:hypothetical protein [Phycisphaerae bacterium]